LIAILRLCYKVENNEITQSECNKNDIGTHEEPKCPNRVRKFELGTGKIVGK